MCGIFGVINNKKIDLELALNSLNLLKHRGPDSYGEYKEKGIYMGHRRLSIIDLSQAGKQPMISTCGNIILTVNGEIYNYREIKSELSEKHMFNSNSDSEVIIYGYLEWGMEKLLNKLNGMFAFCLFDKRQNEIFLVRDRVGIKPIYYHFNGESLAWASEIKALKFYFKDLKIDNTALYDYLTYKYIPSPKSLYINTFKLEPGHYLKINTTDLTYVKTKYWDLEFKNEKKNLNDVINEVEIELKKSVENQLVSDVSVGTFLSSGVDSSLVSCFASQIKKNIQTFTLGYEKNDFESEGASYFSKKIKSTHNEFKLSEKKIKKLSKKKLFHDEPFGDLSPQSYFLNKYSKKKCTVILTGDGGDELFFGYNEYERFLYLQKIKKNIPFKSFFLRFNPIKKIKNLFTSEIEQYIVQKGGMIMMEKKEFKKKLMIPVDYDDYWFFKKHFKKELDPLRRLEYLDFKTFLPEHALTRVDRYSMLFGLECRVPFLSNKMIDLAFSIDPKLKYNNGELKFITREILKKYSTHEYAYSKKKGFSFNSGLRKKLYENWEINENITMMKKYL